LRQLGRAVKHEKIYLRAYHGAAEARASMDRYLAFFNAERPHSSLDRQLPNEAYFNNRRRAAAA
jgi:putative transposase